MLSIGVCIILVLSSCNYIGKNVSNTLDYDGNIVLMGRNCLYYNLRLGTMDTIHFNDPYFDAKILCKGQHNNYIVKANKVINMDYDGYDVYRKKYGSVVLHTYNSKNHSLTPIKELLKNLYNLYSLDYDSTTNQYLFSGKIYDQKGIFLLNSEFSIVKIIGENLFRGQNIMARAYFLNSSEIVICESAGPIYTYNYVSNEKKTIGDGCLLALSADRKNILISDKCSGDLYSKIYLYKLRTHEKVVVEPVRYATSVFEFSPDGEKFAFFRRHGIMDGSLQLVVYDIDKSESFLTNIILGMGWGGSINWESN